MSDVIWRGTVDNNKFECQVFRVDENTGQLVVSVVESREILVDAPVTLAYGAVLGPDVDDVSEWMGISIDAIDNWIANAD